MTVFMAGIGHRHSWPNGKPVRSEKLPDGQYRHTLDDGRKITVGPLPTYRIDYLSTFVGAAPGETYEINVSLGGLADEAGFYWAWNFDIGDAGELRHYRFDKTVKITDLSDGWSTDGETFRKQLEG